MNKEPARDDKPPRDANYQHQLPIDPQSVHMRANSVYSDGKVRTSINNSDSNYARVVA